MFKLTAIMLVATALLLQFEVNISTQNFSNLKNTSVGIHKYNEMNTSYSVAISLNPFVIDYIMQKLEIK